MCRGIDYPSPACQFTYFKIYIKKKKKNQHQPERFVYNSKYVEFVVNWLKNAKHGPLKWNSKKGDGANPR